jgi:hypothetical protein
VTQTPATPPEVAFTDLTWAQQLHAAVFCETAVNTIMTLGWRDEMACTPADPCPTTGPVCVLCAIDQTVDYYARHHSRRNRPPWTTLLNLPADDLSYRLAGTYCKQLITAALTAAAPATCDCPYHRGERGEQVRVVLLDLAVKIRMGATPRKKENTAP